MTRDQLISRARSAIRQATSYRLGSGAPPSTPLPKDEFGFCDCSGFVCWALGISRHQAIFASLKAFNGGWLNTDGIVFDSLLPTGYFEPVSSVVEGSALPGDLVVYPSRSYARSLIKGSNGPRVGHVGILAPDANVIHCSLGNHKRYGDAIAETDLSVFYRVSYSRYVRFAGLTD